MKYFMVALGELAVSDEARFSDMLGEHSFGFWHRIPGVWFVVVPNEMDASEFEDMVYDLFGESVNTIVAEINPKALSVRLPRSYAMWFEKHLNLDFDFGSIPDQKKRDDATQK